MKAPVVSRIAACDKPHLGAPGRPVMWHVVPPQVRFMPDALVGERRRDVPGARQTGAPDTPITRTWCPVRAGEDNSTSPGITGVPSPLTISSGRPGPAEQRPSPGGSRSSQAGRRPGPHRARSTRQAGRPLTRMLLAVTSVTVTTDAPGVPAGAQRARRGLSSAEASAPASQHVGDADGDDPAGYRPDEVGPP